MPPRSYYQKKGTEPPTTIAVGPEPLPPEPFTQDFSRSTAVNTSQPQLVSEEIQTDQWLNRRRMAYVALAAMLIVTAYSLSFMPESRLKTAEIVITWFFMGMTSIVGAYMGLATWSDIKKR